MSKPKYEIGQQVWWARWHRTETSIGCPDCGGTGRLRVIFHDETIVSIDCQNCSIGYDPPTGRVKCYNRSPTAEKVTIVGMEIVGDKPVDYHTSGSYRIPEDRLFETEAAAIFRAAEGIAEGDQQERDEILSKEKDTRTWAWNASYHRNNIKRAEKDLVYHTAKLEVARLKTKR